MHLASQFCNTGYFIKFDFGQLFGKFNHCVTPPQYTENSRHGRERANERAATGADLPRQTACALFLRPCAYSEFGRAGGVLIAVRNSVEVVKCISEFNIEQVYFRLKIGEDKLLLA